MEQWRRMRLVLLGVLPLWHRHLLGGVSSIIQIPGAESLSAHVQGATER